MSRIAVARIELEYTIGPEDNIEVDIVDDNGDKEVKNLAIEKFLDDLQNILNDNWDETKGHWEDTVYDWVQVRIEDINGN